MGVPASRLNRRVAIEQPITKYSEASGTDETEGFKPVCSMWAEYKPSGGGQGIDAAQISSEASGVFFVRDSSFTRTIVPGWRLILSDVVYSVVAADLAEEPTLRRLIVTANTAAQ